MALLMSQTSKYSIWSLRDDIVKPSPLQKHDVFEKDEVSVEDNCFLEEIHTSQADNANDAMTMLGGSFAMSMFTVVDDDDAENEDNQSTNAQRTEDGKIIPDAATLLQQCVNGDNEVNKNLADPAYWETLAEATASLYPFDPLTIGETLGKRTTYDDKPPTSASTSSSQDPLRGKLQHDLYDKGYTVVPPKAQGKNTIHRQNHSQSAASNMFGSGGNMSGFGAGGFEAPPLGFSSGTFGGDGLAFINNDDMGFGAGSGAYQPPSSRSGFPGGFGVPSDDVMARAVRVVEDHGWPPVFALMFDAPWAAVQRAWGIAAAVLGEDCELEPSLFIWSLTKNIDIRNQKEKKVQKEDREEEKRCSRIGQNFSLPHRDFSYDEAHFPDGSPRILNVWVPFTDVDPDNGCLWVVPREFDEHYDKPDDYEHSRPATPSSFERNCNKVRFNIGAARPIIAAKGSAVAWHNIIHWGGACSKDAQIPRISLAATFKAKKSKATHLTSNGLLSSVFDKMTSTSGVTQNKKLSDNFTDSDNNCFNKLVQGNKSSDDSEIKLTDRIKLIASALLIYSDWFDLEGEALPDDFYKLAGYPKPQTPVVSSSIAVPMEAFIGDRTNNVEEKSYNFTLETISPEEFQGYNPGEVIDV